MLVKPSSVSKSSCLNNILFLLVVTCFLGCAKSNQLERQVAREAGDSLTKDYAFYRSSVLSNIKYNLALDLTGVGDSFTGANTLEFDVGQPQVNTLTVDFKGDVTSVTLNGKAIRWAKKPGFIELVSPHFIQGRNSLAIEFKAQYAKSGMGLVRYLDATSNSRYVYTNLEPFSAHSVFPCFDQPDLRAVFQTTVKIPQLWTAISATDADEIVPAGGTQTVRFPESPIMPTYAYPLIAGQFAVYEDTYNEKPLRLYYRPIIEREIDPKQWLTETKAGLIFFEDTFSTSYPYAKYDQILLPDLQPVAMENVAASTFRESFFVGSDTYLKRQRHMNVIIHELSHMWFGNLVGIRWWDDLWLNESLATYFSAFMQAKASEFSDTAWMVFDNESILSAIDKDAKPSTHPVAMQIKSTDDIKGKFDGISYQKGASLVRQLHRRLGDDAFLAAVSAYLTEYQNRSAASENFLGVLESFSDFDSEPWSYQWLQTQGVNTLSVTYECHRQVVTSLTIAQATSPFSDVLRSQWVDLDLYRKNNKTLEHLQTVPVLYDGEKTILSSPKAVACPDFILINKDSTAYLQSEIGEESLSFFIDNQALFNDDVSLRVWSDLWQMVLGGSLGIDQYAQTLMASLPEVKSDYLTRILLQKLGAIKSLYERSPLPTQRKRSMLKAIEAAAYDVISSPQRPLAFRRIAFNFYINLVSTEPGLSRLKDSLAGIEVVPGVEVSARLRWFIITKLNKYAYADYESITEAEHGGDDSRMGNRMYEASKVIRPNAGYKTKWLEDYLAGVGDQDAANFAVNALFPPSQAGIAQQQVGTILSMVAAEKHKLSDSDAAKVITVSVKPICDKASVDAIKSRANAALKNNLQQRSELDDVWFEVDVCINLFAQM